VTEIEPFEYVRSYDPFVVRRRVKFSECDPAGVVWTGNFFEYAGSASRLYLRHLLDLSGVAQPTHDPGIGMPVKAYSMVFSRALWPDESFDMTPSVTNIRTSTFTMHVDARCADTTAFSADITTICIRPNVRSRIPIPPDIREALETMLSA
jgi:4-hydroxybenzoyl-CoA thioesterase